MDSIEISDAERQRGERLRLRVWGDRLAVESVALRDEMVVLASTDDRAALEKYEHRVKRHQLDLQRFREQLSRFHGESGLLDG